VSLNNDKVVRVLSCEADTTIFIGEEVSLIVCSVEKKGQVRVGISAPKTVPVNRREIYLKKTAMSKSGMGGEVSLPKTKIREVP